MSAPQQAFLDLVNPHRGIVYKICNLYCDDAEARKDLFQEVMLQLWKAFPTFRHESKLSTWMYRIALNTAISNFRRERRKPQVSSLDDLAFDVPDLGDTETSEDLARLMSAIARLNDLEKAIILLYLDEKSYLEIAAITGISRSNVAVRIHRIKTKLETSLNS